MEKGFCQKCRNGSKGQQNFLQNCSVEFQSLQKELAYKDGLFAFFEQTNSFLGQLWLQQQLRMTPGFDQSHPPGLAGPACPCTPLQHRELKSFRVFQPARILLNNEDLPGEECSRAAVLTQTAALLCSRQGEHTAAKTHRLLHRHCEAEEQTSEPPAPACPQLQGLGDGTTSAALPIQQGRKCTCPFLGWDWLLLVENRTAGASEHM